MFLGQQVQPSKMWDKKGGKLSRNILIYYKQSTQQTCKMNQTQRNLISVHNHPPRKKTFKLRLWCKSNRNMQNIIVGQLCCRFNCTTLYTERYKTTITMKNSIWCMQGSDAELDASYLREILLFELNRWLDGWLLPVQTAHLILEPICTTFSFGYGMSNFSSLPWFTCWYITITTDQLEFFHSTCYRASHCIYYICTSQGIRAIYSQITW